MSSNHPEPTIRQYTSADWQTVRDICIAAFTPIHEGILLAELDGGVVGFVHYELRPDKLSAKLGLNAVHPGWQRRGIAAKLYTRVFDILRAEGMKFVQVGTGGDDAHIPARRAYEKSGFTPIPVVHYFKKL
jgi:GNAT superfamily N-acetyltransferase